MLTAKHILEHFEEIKQKVESRGFFGRLLDDVRDVALSEREKLRELEELRAKKNRLSEQFIKDKKEGRDTEALTSESRKIGEQINFLGEEMTGISRRWTELAQSIPQHSP